MHVVNLPGLEARKAYSQLSSWLSEALLQVAGVADSCLVHAFVH